MNPLQQAIINGEKDVVETYKHSSYADALDPLGFSPLELAKLLGKQEIQKILMPKKPLSIKVQLKDEPIKLMTKRAFEEHFHLKYRSCLTFTSYEQLKEAVKNCPYFFKLQWIFGSDDALEVSYKEKLEAAALAKIIVKWVDPTFQYGLFADADLEEKAFIGEYAGVMRRIDKKHPDLNGYCFHYPTKFFSLHYAVIDALLEGNLMRFINHSDSPNVQPLWLYDKGLLHLVFIANRLIKQGEQLYFNYGKDYWLKRKCLNPYHFS